MLTRRIDDALTALSGRHEHVPFLRDLQPEGSPMRAALDEVLTAVKRARAYVGAGRQ